MKSNKALIGHGKFVVSLDFELFWGVRDVKTMENYGENVKGVHKALPAMIGLFNAYNVNATFSTVGFLFCETKTELLKYIPAVLPAYKNRTLSPYEGHIDSIGENVTEDPYHFAPHLIDLIIANPQHELGTHTFSHFYCLEEGQTIEAFQADLRAAKSVAKKYNLELTSLVFPRNQFNREYLAVIEQEGLICFRGTENSWLYEAKNTEKETTVRRGLRLADSYINLTGHNTHTDQMMTESFPVNIPGSRFLRPFNSKTSFLDGLKLKRIKQDMTYAARNHTTFHLWWHPHNFGVNLSENLDFLKKILAHYLALNKTFGFTSYTMSALAKKLSDAGR
jgi:peptidoglycan/xylan/chitin deacetylase (PgdA/CDA1 family)